jgi:hypothetical protein
MICMMLLKLRLPTLSRAAAAISLLLSFGASLAQSTESDGARLRVSGFGTLGMVHASADEGWGYVRDLDQTRHRGGTRVDTDTRLGLQLNYALNPQFEWVGQLLAKRRLGSAKADAVVEWGFAAWRPSAGLTLRAGRVNVDQFLMSDYRNVGFAYPFARPPVDFYALLPSSLDGADLTQSWQVGDTRWRAKAFAGQARTGEVNLRRLYGAMLSREAGGLLLRAGVTRTTLKDTTPTVVPLLDALSGIASLPLPTVAAEALALRHRVDLTGADITYAALGFSYERAEWQLSGEITRTSGHPGVRFDAGYMALGRRFGAMTVYSMLSRIRSPEAPATAPAWGLALEPILGPVAAQQAQGLADAAAYAVNVSRVDQQTTALGARWDVHPRLALKLQWDHVRVKPNGGLLWANPTPAAMRANVGSLLADFVF